MAKHGVVSAAATVIANIDARDKVCPWSCFIPEPVLALPRVCAEKEEAVKTHVRAPQTAAGASYGRSSVGPRAPGCRLTRGLRLDPLGLLHGRARCAFAFDGANSSPDSAPCTKVRSEQ